MADTNDSEDDEILDEIKALENALAPQISNQKIYDNSSDFSVNLNVTERLLDTQVNEPSDSHIKHLQTAYELNEQLIQSLTIAKNEIKKILCNCEQKLSTIDERLNTITKSCPNGRIFICSAGIPYFKDKFHFPAPKNEDAKTKAANNELQLFDLRKVCRWTPKDRNILFKAIRQQALNSLLKQPNDDSSEEETEKEDDSNVETLKTLIPKEFKDLVGSLETKEFDWMRISVQKFNGRHSPEECRAMWKVFLHPDINKCKWTKAEDSKMRAIVDRHEHHNWDLIASELSTNRSGYQCFIRYNTGKRNLALNKVWNKNEDRKLLKIINELKIGDFIPWGEVASCMSRRTKQQVYFRWMYSLAPNLKKGRFTEEEDKALMDGVARFGKNFAKISAVLIPNRSTIQLSDHYQTLVARSRGLPNQWSKEDDEKLIRLYKSLGPNWTKIAQSFENKSRIQVRHRYAAVMKCKSKGLTIRHKPLDSRVQDPDRLLIDHFHYTNLNLNSINNKLYNPIELEEATIKVYNILKLLKSDIYIPRMLNGILISNRDKQLLHSLRNYMTKKDKFRSEETERTRLRMFGPDSENDQPHFIPPLPLGGYSKSKKRRPSEIIDYSINENNKFLIDVPKEFETPDPVIFFIGGVPVQVQFDKICKILHYSEERSNRTEILSSRASTKSQLKSKNVKTSKPEKTATCKENKSSNSFVNSKVGQKKKREKTSNNSSEKLIFESNFLKPNHSTIIGLGNLLSSKEFYELEESQFYEIDQSEVTSPSSNLVNDIHLKSQDMIACDLLKARLRELFSFPISLFYVEIPEKYKQDDSSITEISSIPEEIINEDIETLTKNKRIKLDISKVETEDEEMLDLDSTDEQHFFQTNEEEIVTLDKVFVSRT